MHHLPSKWPEEFRRRLRRAIHDPAEFVSLTLTDSTRKPLKRNQLHDDLQEFLSAHPKSLIELPRDHGKTVQVCGRILWELGRNPALRVKLVCATDALAAERSRFLRDTIAGTGLIHLVFPKLQPATPWCASAFTIQRPADVIGPSLSAFGVGSGSTGARADLLVCDDIVDVRSLHCPGERRRVRDYFQNNLMNLLEPDGRFWNLFTPWHPDDLNAHLKANGKFAHFHRSIGPDLEPIWPAKWSREKLLERQAEIGETSFARGYRLLSLSDADVLIRPEWMQFWQTPQLRNAYERIALAVDPAVSTKPNADRSAMIVAGAIGGKIEVLQATATRVRTPALIERIDALDRQWQPDVILFESNAAFAGIRDLLIHRTRFGAKVIGKPASRSKDARIAALSVAVQNGCVRLHGEAATVDPTQRELFAELTSYPFSTHDDLADATAAAVEYLLHQPQPRLWL
jgi:predicted phage terminase large subunit-like protein